MCNKSIIREISQEERAAWQKFQSEELGIEGNAEAKYTHVRHVRQKAIKLFRDFSAIKMIDLWQESRGGTVRVENKGRMCCVEVKQLRSMTLKYVWLVMRKGLNIRNCVCFFLIFSNREFDCEGEDFDITGWFFYGENEQGQEIAIAVQKNDISVYPYQNELVDIHDTISYKMEMKGVREVFRIFETDVTTVDQFA